MFFFMMFGLGLGLFLDPTQFVVSDLPSSRGRNVADQTFQWCSEAFPTTIRAKGLTIALFTYFAATVLYTAPAPKAFANIGWKFYLVFISCDVVCFAMLYKWLPETANLTLEEIGKLFGDEVVTHFAQDGNGLVEVDAMADFDEKSIMQIEEATAGCDGK
jgi:hypothetical protein